MWYLVLVQIAVTQPSGELEPRADTWWEFNSFYECFVARESLGLQFTGNPGYFPPNTQAVCIPVNKNE